MGGFGSGRRRAKALTVEKSFSLSIGSIKNALCRGPGSTCSVYWTIDDNVVHEAWCSIRLQSEHLAVRVRHYDLPRKTDCEEHEQWIDTSITHPYFGGVRFWFTCPICRKRFSRLYLRSSQGGFLCRICLQLTYRSAQKHDHRLDTIRKNNDLWKRIIQGRSHARDTILALKAMHL